MKLYIKFKSIHTYMHESVLHMYMFVHVCAFMYILIHAHTENGGESTSQKF